MSERTAADWLGLLLASESNEPTEWPFIGWVAINRLHAKGRPKTMREVVLQNQQFSFFNQFQGMDLYDEAEAIFSKALAQYPGKLFPEARRCAEHLLTQAPWQAPFPPDVYHFYAPVSMKPKNTAPYWAETATRAWTPPGFDRLRLVLCAGVK